MYKSYHRTSPKAKNTTLLHSQGKDSVAMDVLQMDVTHLGIPMRSLSAKKIMPPRVPRSNSKKLEARTLEKKGR